MITTPAFAKPVLNIEHWTTANGARILFVATHQLPMIDIEVAFNAGSARDAEYPGVAQFTNAMLEEGTKTLSADQIAANFATVGAQFDATAGRDMAVLHLRTLSDPKLLQPALVNFAAVITEPTFPEAGFKRVQKQILSAFAAEKQHPSSVAKNAFFKALYKGQPYEHPVLGTPKSVKSLTSAALQQFYRKYYVAKNANISIVGDLSLAQAKKIAEKLVGKLASGEAAAPLAAIPAVTKKQSKQIKFPAEQANIIIGQVGVARDNPDLFPLFVGNYILGESPLTSELFQEVRNKRGYAYSVSSVFLPLQTQGPFVIVLQTRTDAANKAIAVAKKTLVTFVEQGPSAQQLAAAKQSLLGHFPLGIANNAQILEQLNLIGFYKLPLDYLDTYRDKVSAVTLPQLKAAWQHYIQPDKMITVIVGK